MNATYLVSVSCPDRTGLVAAITARLFDLGGNLGDTTFAVYGTEAEFTTLVDMPDSPGADKLRSELADLDQTKGATINVTPFDRSTDHGALTRGTHTITISGGDQPGFIARITEVFVEFGANIIHLEAFRDQNRYTTRFSVAISAKNADKCLATVANTAESLDLTCGTEQIN
ncbi:MAG: ACT domain-containing protein [Rhodospirillales bacterium]|nr:ACT domain-containing protein [Rhodospirillales bacterium]